MCFDQINLEGPKKVLLSYENLSNIIPENNLKHLDSLIKKISQTQFYHNSKLSSEESELVEKLLDFGTQKFSLDLLRMIVNFPNLSELLKSDFITKLMILMLDSLKNEDEIVNILGYRILCNLFNHSLAIPFLTDKRDDIINLITNRMESKNDKLRSSIISLIFNYSILLYNTSFDDTKGQLVEISSVFLENEDQVANVNNLLISIANIAHHSNENMNIIKDLGIKDTILKLKNGNDVIAELKEFFKKSL